jgi:hypothetical protein
MSEWAAPLRIWNSGATKPAEPTIACSTFAANYASSGSQVHGRLRLHLGERLIDAIFSLAAAEGVGDACTLARPCSGLDQLRRPAKIALERGHTVNAHGGEEQRQR